MARKLLILASREPIPDRLLGDYKYWTMTECADIDLDDDEVLNRALLYRDRRDFVIRKGDTGKRET